MSNSNDKDTKPAAPQYDAPLLDHDYDGIQELDNRLPNWWLALFYLTIAFAAGYYFHYSLSDGPSLDQELQADLDAIEIKKQQSAPPDQGADPAKLTAFLKNPGKVENGKTVFVAKCASCHGAQGQGSIGPNLVDKNWVNGDGTLSSIAKVVKDGVPAKGMPPWGALLSEEELYSVVAYIKSLKGTNPPGAKAPQGTAYEN